MRVSSGVRMSGPLEQHRVGFSAALFEQGYTDVSVAQQLRLLAHFSRWLHVRGVEPARVDEVVLGAYLSGRREEGRTEWCSAKGLAPMLSHLRSVGAIAGCPAVVDESPAGRFLEPYRCYLSQERGLAKSTVDIYLTIARAFFGACCDANGALGPVMAADVARFVVAECSRRSGRPNVVTALRSFLRYLFLEGLVSTQLAWAVPSVSGSHQATLPRDVALAHVACILAGCDRRQGTGRRDFAMITVISRLGVRATEVGALDLDDIDWHSGDVVIRGKGRREERLPLPGDVGEAIVAYLVGGRPPCALRALFVSARAPWRRLAQPSVTDIIFRACERAGVPRFGPHRLRHTVATQMLRNGGSLAEVAQVLRHHDALTTATYAKVDRQALAELALPWPGSSR